MIPQVRKWRVKFYDGKTLLVDATVETINKRFARWLANERNGYPALRSDRVTVSVVEKRLSGDAMIWRSILAKGV